MIFIIIWFDIASEEIELNANPFNPFFMSAIKPNTIYKSLMGKKLKNKENLEYSKYRELLKKKYYLRAYNFSDN